MICNVLWLRFGNVVQGCNCFGGRLPLTFARFFQDRHLLFTERRKEHLLTLWLIHLVIGIMLHHIAPQDCVWCHWNFYASMWHPLHTCSEVEVPIWLAQRVVWWLVYFHAPLSAKKNRAFNADISQLLSGTQNSWHGQGSQSGQFGFYSAAGKRSTGLLMLQGTWPPPSKLASLFRLFTASEL